MEKSPPQFFEEFATHAVAPIVLTVGELHSLTPVPSKKSSKPARATEQPVTPSAIRISEGDSRSSALVRYRAT
jgi:hypothetical protein